MALEEVLMLTIEEILKFMHEYGSAKTVDTYQFMVIQSGDPLLRSK